VASAERVLLDLNSPVFLDVFLRLEAAELAQVVGTLDRIRKLDWRTLYAHHGLKWEALDHLPTPSGAKGHSIRLSRKVRGIAYRDGAFLRFLSLHPDHDSAYRR
jgi:hypothetical protein